MQATRANVFIRIPILTRAVTKRATTTVLPYVNRGFAQSPYGLSQVSSRAGISSDERHAKLRYWSGEQPTCRRQACSV